MFFKYIREKYINIIYFLCNFIIVNLVIYLSPIIDLEGTETYYLNFLMIVAFLSIYAIDFYKWNKHIKELNQNKDTLLSYYDNLKYKTIKEEINLEFMRTTEILNENKNLELQKSQDDVIDYITNWVHQIKIPISVLELVIKDMEDSFLDYEVCKKLRIEVERVKFLIDQALYISRASSYSEDFKIEYVNLKGIINEVIKKNRVLIIYNKIEIDIHELNFEVLTDKKWIIYVIEQIINNSCKYIKDNGKITIGAEKNDKGIHLLIEDNGIGIESEDLNRIFYKGFTGNNGRKIAKSTGMGLYISKMICNKLNHDLYISSEVNRYTRFTIGFYNISDYFNLTQM